MWRGFGSGEASRWCLPGCFAGLLVFVGFDDEFGLILGFKVVSWMFCFGVGLV